MKKEYKYPQMQVEEIYLSTSICSDQSDNPNNITDPNSNKDPFGHAPARILYM